MNYEPFGKLFVTPVLPLCEDGSIDEEGFRILIRRFLTPEYLAAGMALIANPSAGEIFGLNHEERRHAIKIIREETSGRAPVLAGVVGGTTAEAVRTAKDAAEAGVQGLFMFPPAVAGEITNSWDSESYPNALLDVLHAVRAEVDLPMVVHPVGKASAAFGPGISDDMTIRIIEQVPNVVGWKMTYNYEGYRSVTRALRRADRPVDVLAAMGKYYHENLANDAFDGTCSGAFNYALEPMMEHISAWKSGDIDRATKIWNNGLAELQEYIFLDDGRLQVRYKAATWLRGFIANPFRRHPSPRPLRSEIERLATLLQGAGVSIIDRDVIDDLVGRSNLLP